MTTRPTHWTVHDESGALIGDIDRGYLGRSYDAEVFGEENALRGRSYKTVSSASRAIQRWVSQRRILQREANR